MRTQAEKDRDERVQTSYEKEHDIVPGTESRTDAMLETPEQYQERVDRDVREGLRAPPPEQVDMTQSTVTPDQIRGMEHAAPKPHLTKGHSSKEGNLGKPSSGSSPRGDESVDYEEMTIPELKDLAHKRGVEISHDMRKDEIIAALEKGA